MIELIAKDINGDIWDLDVDQNEVIALTKNFLSLTDIEQRTGDFTRSFSLPRSFNNDLFFGQIGDPSHVGGYWTTRFEAPTWLIQDSNIIIEGSLRLESTNPDHDKYTISVSGRTYSIKSLIGDALMSELDMSAWTYDSNDIDDTWGGTWVGGHLIFSVNDPGQGFGQYVKEGDPAVLTLQDIQVNTTPLRLWETLPTYRLNELLRKIFNEKGLTVGGSWFNDTINPETEKIYVQISNQISEFVSTASTLHTQVGSQMILASTAPAVMTFVAVPGDAAWNDITHEYTCPQSGTYYWNLDVFPTQGTPSNIPITINFQVNNIDYGSGITFTWNTNYSGTNIAVTMSAGDTMRLRYRLVAVPTTPGSIDVGSATFLDLNFADLGGTDINPADFWTSHRQIDFLRSITQIFNLIIWLPSDNEVTIDTWNHYMSTYGEKKDWSDKLDSESIVVKPINGELRNPINLALKNGQDILNTEYQDVTGRAYGSYREDTLIPFAQDAAAPISDFVPGPTQSIISTDPAADFDDFIVHKFYSDIDNIGLKSSGLQLYYYNGLRTVTTFHVRNTAGGGTTAKTQYPYFSNFRLYSGDSWQVQDDSLDLNFTYWTPPSDIVDAPSELGLYNRYFADMLRERYDLANKILECKMVLNPTDIANFSFADTIVVTVNGTPVGLKILEIKDYSTSEIMATQIRAMITFLG